MRVDSIKLIYFRVNEFDVSVSYSAVYFSGNEQQ